MRDIKNDVRSAAYYAVRDVFKRPREIVTLTAIMSAIMLTLVLLLLWLEADWRADVMPEIPSNYHFEVEGLTAEEKAVINELEWVAVTYDMPRYEESSEYTFRVRIKWEYLNDNPVNYIREVWNRFDLKNRDPYRVSYRNSYNSYYEKFSTGGGSNPLLFFKKINSSPEDAARDSAERNSFESIRNRGYCTKTTQSYMLMPNNLITIILFTFFLGGVVFIITNERYRRNLSETGALRAIGFAKWQLYIYYVVRGTIVAFAALLPATLVSSLAVFIYGLVTKNVASSDESYLVISESIPISNLVVTFMCLFVMTAIANVIVCFSYHKYTVMDGLRGRETLEIGYVEMSSYRFENASGDLAYTFLYHSRTKKRMLTNAIAVAIMAPLPLFYLSLASVITGDITSVEEMLFAFQSIVLTLAAVAVIALSVIYTVRGRRPELSMLRAMGMSKLRVARTVIVSTLTEGIIASIMAGFSSSFIYLYMLSSMSSEYAAYAPFTGDSNAPMFILEWIVNSFKLLPMAAVLVLVSELIGAVLGIVIYQRGGIIEGVRRTD